MEKATMCACLNSDHALPQWKCFMRCCSKCPSINLPDQETDDQYFNTSPSIRFHIYHVIAHCTENGSILLNDRKICCKCKYHSASEQSTKIYTRKELVTMETKIYNFHTI